MFCGATIEARVELELLLSEDILSREENGWGDFDFFLSSSRYRGALKTK